MRLLQHLFDNNETWASGLKERDPDFFRKLSSQQSPDYLWIGCPDSRVPANDIVGLLPGELFVHRNVGNIVNPTDMNCLSVIQYAVEVLQVKHIIVCGHYGCGGVRSALDNRERGLIDNWLRHIKDIYDRNRTQLDRLDLDTKVDKLCELNVIRQVANVCYTSFVQNAWKQGRELAVHGWIYSISDGVLRDLGVCVDDSRQVPPIYRFGAGD